MIKVITFDLDDTLWDLKPVLNNAENRVFDWLKQYTPDVAARYTLGDIHNWRISYYQQRADLKHQISQIRIVAMQGMFQQCGYGEKESIELSKQAFSVFIDARHEVAVFEHTERVLASLKENYSIGALTNGNANVFRLNIGQYFDFAFSAEQLNSSKPAADHFIAAQKHANCKAAEIIHIGDHIEHDVAAAQQAGCYSIWFNPDGKINTCNANPSQQINCLSDIERAVKSIQQLCAPK